MNDEDLLRSALGTLTADQPPAPDRVLGVRRRVRRRTQQRAAVAGTLALAGVLGAAAVLQPGDPVERTLPPAGPGLQWEPRGELVDEADVAVQAWAPEGVEDLRVLYAGALSTVDTRLQPTAERWYVLQGDPGDGLQVAVVRDADGTGPAAPLVVGQRTARSDARQVSALLTEVPPTAGDVVWPGKPGVALRSVLFVLPRPGADSVVQRTTTGEGLPGVTSAPAVPYLTSLDTPAFLGLQVDGGPVERAGLPGSQPAALTVAPPPVPGGWVVASSGTGAGSTSGGPAYDVPVRVLVRCTTWGGPLRVEYDQQSLTQEADVACDGTTQEPFGEVPPALDRAERPTDTLALTGDDVDQAHWVLLVRQADADRLGIRPPTG